MKMRVHETGDDHGAPIAQHLGTRPAKRQRLVLGADESDPLAAHRHRARMVSAGGRNAAEKDEVGLQTARRAS